MSGTAVINEGGATVTNERKNRTKNIVALVEIMDDENGGTVFRQLPIPADAKSHNRSDIFKAVQHAAETGSTIYDNRKLAVISYQPPKTLYSETVKKTSFK